MADYDAIVVGAGPAGSAAAHALAGGGARTLLLDRASFPRDKTCGDGLSPRAVAVLAEMGLLEELLPLGRVVRSISVVGPNGRPVEAPVPAHPGLPDYSLVVPRLTLDDALRRKAVGAGAAFQGEVHVWDVEVVGGRGENGRVRVSGSRTGKSVEFHARVAVLATGAAQKLLRAAGVLTAAPPVMLAARAYFEAASDLPGGIEFRFDGAPLPGYGWLFPVSARRLNVGAGYFQCEGRATGRLPPSPRVAFERFVAHPPIRRALAGARQVGPLRSYPLRVDFLSAPTHAERLLLAGEAAGLVNPLTGEGIDYALESGRMAAAAALRALASGDFSREALGEYDRELRRRFQVLFVFCSRVRDRYLHPWLLNWLVSLARRRADLKMALIDIALSNAPAAENVSPWRAARAILRGCHLPRTHYRSPGQPPAAGEW